MGAWRGSHERWRVPPLPEHEQTAQPCCRDIIRIKKRAYQTWIVRGGRCGRNDTADGSWTLVPRDSMERVVVATRDTPVRSRLLKNSVSLLLVAFMLANSQDPSWLISSKPPATITLALRTTGYHRQSQWIAKWSRCGSPLGYTGPVFEAFTHQAPTGVSIGPLEAKRSKLTRPAVVFINLPRES